MLPNRAIWYILPKRQTHFPAKGLTRTMANFHTHVTLSAFFGIGYGAAGHLTYDVPLPSAVLAGGLCTIAGMLPDVDSDNGVPLREFMTFFAAVAPMFFLDRFRELGWPQETIILAAALIYVCIRFGVAEIVRRGTVHRGMWHSIPAAAIAALVTYHLCASPDMRLRLYKTGAVLLGFLSHLVLDEIYSTDVGIRGLRVKKSFGTALKMWGRNPGANLVTYSCLALLGSMTYWEPVVLESLFPRDPLSPLPATAMDPLAPYPAYAPTPPYPEYPYQPPY